MRVGGGICLIRPPSPQNQPLPPFPQSDWQMGWKRAGTTQLSFYLKARVGLPSATCLGPVLGGEEHQPGEQHHVLRE